MTGRKFLARFAFGSLHAAAILLSLLALKTSAQSVEPSAQPLLTQDGLIYLGGFRMPGNAINGIDFTYGGSPIAFNPVNNSLFVGNANYIAEISIPTALNSSDSRAMPAATYLQQAFVDPTEGHLKDLYAGDSVIYGLMVSGNRLIGSASIYYDASNRQRVSHFARSLTLTQPSFSGWSQVWDSNQQGYVSGWMAAVPAEWQARLGGPAITGQCCIPIVSRTSYGPAAFAFDPAAVGLPRVNATPLLYYTENHKTLGPWEGSNENYGSTARIGGLAIIAGTRTALFVGSIGLGAFCYGDGVSDPAKADGVTVCYDPTDSNKGPHSYPYRYQVWAYDLNEWAAVKAKSKQPWDVRPYAVWPLKFPTTADQLIIGGVAYDAQRQVLYISQRHGNRGEFSSGPVIHAFTVTTRGR